MKPLTAICLFGLMAGPLLHEAGARTEPLPQAIQKAMLVACQHADTAAAQTLLAGALAGGGRAPMDASLLQAVANQDEPMLRMWLALGADPNAWGRDGTALDVATASGANAARDMLICAITGIELPGNGKALDGRVVISRLRVAAERGDAAAQYCLARACQEGRDTRRDTAEAVGWYRKAAEQGHGVAQHRLGVCYERGAGVPRDSAEALKWYRKAAGQGYAPSQNNLADSYAHGARPAEDYPEAFRWYRMAAAQELPMAEYGLGMMYLCGKGVAADSTEAVNWFRVAAGHGHLGANYEMGIAYAWGRGVPQDPEEGLRWFRAGAEHGDVDCIFSLGVSYQLGRGAPRDRVMAHAWYSLAEARGAPDAEKLRTDLEASMNARQLGQARQAAARLCQEMPLACPR